MTRQIEIDVLICGAGPAGLTLAIELARRGVSFVLIEKAEAPFGGSRGKGIQPRTLEIFDDFGIVDRVFATGGPYPGFRTYHADGTLEDAAMMEEHAPTPDVPYAMPLMIPQFATEGILRGRLAELGHSPCFGEELTKFEQDESGISGHAATADGETIYRARYLAATDGGRSFIRESLTIGFPGRSLDTRAIVADLVMSGLDREHWHRFVAPSGGATLICPLAGTDLFQLQAPVPLEGDVDITVEGLEAFMRERTGRSDLSVQSVSWASVYNMSARLADSYRVGRVFLAGDAAHIHPPTGAQGLNTSVQDSYNLGWKLAAVLSGADQSLLDSYEAERRPIAAGMLELSAQLLKDSRGAAMRRGRETQQLDLGYPDSPVSLAGSRTDHPLTAGDRAPDAPLKGAGGQSLRLFDLLRGPHWTLLGMQTDAQLIDLRPGLNVHVAGADIIDNNACLAKSTGLAPGDWMLIRPDGYIAAIVDADQTPSLLEYLQEHVRVS